MGGGAWISELGLFDFVH